MKRIFFFALVNILVVTSVTIITGIVCQFIYGTPVPPENSLIPLIIFSALLGMGGSVISLFLSKWMAKKMMGLQMIAPNTTNPRERELLEMVENMARKARLPKMPEVGYYQSAEMNAFATGPSKSNSLVAVSSGLMDSLNKGELEAVIGHEVAHIANGDMVTLTLIQGIINTFVIFLSRIFANLIASQFKDNRFLIEFGLVILMQIVFSMLGAIVVAYFSRQREYRADRGGARYSSRDNMISALRRLSQQTIPKPKDDNFAAFKIAGTSKISALYRTHPLTEDRIAALERGY